MSEKYKVAIVGCGGISRAHGSASQNLPELTLLVPAMSNLRRSKILQSSSTLKTLTTT